MKKIFLGLVVITTLFVSFNFAEAATRVRSYYKKSGTYVPSHYRSDRNYIKTDNYSHHGNTNPYTGKKGYQW